MKDDALTSLGLTWTDDGVPVGFAFGKEAALRDWAFKKEFDEKSFSKLCRRISWNNYQRKRWATMTPEQRAEVTAYRKRWAREHWEQYLAATRAGKRRWRANKKNHAKELAARRAKREAEQAKRRAETVYTCQCCGSQWSPVGRIPSRRPLYCSTACRNRMAYYRTDREARRSQQRKEKRRAAEARYRAKRAEQRREAA